jgi:hypothetical protein
MTTKLKRFSEVNACEVTEALASRQRGEEVSVADLQVDHVLGMVRDVEFADGLREKVLLDERG